MLSTAINVISKLGRYQRKPVNKEFWRLMLSITNNIENYYSIIQNHNINENIKYW